MRIVKSHRVWCAALGVAAAMMTAPAGVALAATPEVQTEAATAITASGATLNGELNTGVSSEKLEYDFAYSAGNRCEGGTLAPEPAASAEGAHKKVTTTVSALEPNTEYTVCLNATNSEDQTASGAPVSFTTASVKPVIGGEHVETESVGAFDAALEAEVNPENRVTTYSFEYSTSKTLAGARTVGEASLARAFASETVGPVDLERALKPSTTYYYRAVAANAAGASTGPILSFTTAAINKPSVSGESVSEITPTTAVAHELVNPEYQETTCLGVQYIDQQAFEATGYAAAAEVPCTHRHSERPETATATLTDLDANTTYHYRILVENASGLTEGPDATFRAAPYPPEVHTGEASAITTSGATIAGSVDPGSTGPNSDTEYFFEYGPTTDYGSRTPLAAGDAGEGENAVQETAALEGLSADTTYHYRIVATNDLSGTPQSSYGADETFSTLATPPILSGVGLQSVTESAVAIGATLNPQGLVTRYELRVATAPGQSYLAASAETATDGAIALSVGTLSPGTSYYFTLIATSAGGETQAEGVFATPQAANAETNLIQPTTPPLLATPALSFPATLRGAQPPPVLTNAEKLSKALKACKKRPKRERSACEKQARKRYVRKKRG